MAYWADCYSLGFLHCNSDFGSIFIQYNCHWCCLQKSCCRADQILQIRWHYGEDYSQHDACVHTHTTAQLLKDNWTWSFLWNVHWLTEYPMTSTITWPVSVDFVEFVFYGKQCLGVWYETINSWCIYRDWEWQRTRQMCCTVQEIPQTTSIVMADKLMMQDNSF